MNENLETVKKRVERRGKLGSTQSSNGTTNDVSNTDGSLRGGGEQSHLVERTKSGGFVSRRKGSGITYGSKLSDAMLYLEKDVSQRPTQQGEGQRKTEQSCMRDETNKPGGKLNPTFVEFLMGFPMNWTKTEPTESKPSVTQSSHKSQESSDSQSKKFYRTPTAMDKGDNSFKYELKY